MSARITGIGRRVVVATSFAAVAFTSQAVAQSGQTVMEGHRTPRKVLYPIIGAAIGGAASLVYFWSGPRTLPGTCAGTVCPAIASLGGGAFIGWLVGKEKDELHALRYKGGMPLKPQATEVDLAGEPMMLVVADSFVAAVGGGGAQVVANGVKPHVLATRAAGLRQLSDAAMVPSTGEMAITASGGLYKFPLMTGQGVTLRTPPTSAVVAFGNDYVVGAGMRVERVPRTASEPTKWAGITLSDSVRALETDPRGFVWAITETELVSLKPALDSFEVVGRTPLPKGTPQRLDLDGQLIAVALGDSGVRFVNVADATQPKPIVDFKDVRFAHDVALKGTTAFIAAGIDGLVKVSLRNGNQTLKEGIARELGFIVAVEAADPVLWVLDRSGSATLKRIPIDFK
ncbi:MAG TPA: hypothetical protein VE967_12820 [Gemmatimonadaceae bacterium]|nr:hypothetical protein [Gemmatimonadaceae bacterium]